ncbi:hypothetical protein BaRGS_00015322 [Batillaria attramentaria]|uniref:Thioredoxin domain-containing protein n=1 Tax=Batillaria attramentaria TaxID=370345 RepID=A0ABD0L304_9CAEN
MAANIVRVLLGLVVLVGTSLVSASKPDPLLKVTDDNWRMLLEGEWMVEFMAPWCPACRSFETTWRSLAEWSRDLDISVGVVDVTENPGLSGRFLVTSLPTIYHIKDGEFRVFQGERKESELLKFVDDKLWQDVTPVSSWTHPNSFQMGIVGFFFRCAMFIRSFYSTLTTKYGIPEWGCYLIFAVLTIITGLLLGLIFVVCCDWFFPAKYSIPAGAVHVQEASFDDKDKDDESDLIDDTEQPPSQSQSGEAGDSSVRRRQKQGENSPSSAGDTTAASS